MGWLSSPPPLRRSYDRYPMMALTTTLFACSLALPQNTTQIGDWRYEEVESVEMGWFDAHAVTGR